MSWWRSPLLLAVLLIAPGCSREEPGRPPTKNGEESPSPEEKAVLAKLQGQWDIKSPRSKETTTATFNGAQLTFGGGFQGSRYSFRLDPTKNPPTIDLVLEEYWRDKVERKPRTRFHGIYQLDAEKGVFRLRMAEEGFRPKDFGPGQDEGFVLERAR
jgi:uncharacterized protein (TIGR03067 family)